MLRSVAPHRIQWGALLRAFGHARMTNARTRSKVIMGNLFTRIREHSFAVVLTVAAVLTFGALAAAPATAVEENPPLATTVAENLTISGTVTGVTPNGIVPVAGASVRVRVGQSYRGTTTKVDGRYELSGMSTGEAIVSFAAPNADGFGFLGLTTSVPLDGANVTADFLLEQGSVISGVVSKNVLGTTSPAENIEVTILAADGTPGFNGIDYTASDGSYSVNSLAAGSYKVSFGSYGTPTGFAVVYNDNAPTAEGAKSIKVAKDFEVSNIDATLVLDGTAYPISGEVAIVGEARVGQTLSVAGPWTPSDPELSYAWHRSGSYGDVKTSSTYTITEDDLGSTLNVRVTGMATGSATFWSESTKAVQPANTTSTPVSPALLPQTGGVTSVSVVGPKSDRVTMPQKTIAPGASIPITGTGFAPFEVVDIWLHSTPVLLGTLTADALGRVSGSFPMPANIASGTHHIVLVDENGVSYTSAAVVVALADTGTDLSSGWLALALMALGGLALTIRARRRTALALK
ncbi:hypothetical protein SAMN05216281_1094 [Cryobacterium luteum]|nr:hypothetical protein SAMN05216281_1094 [Cryobacterium luteum]